MWLNCPLVWTSCPILRNEIDFKTKWQWFFCCWKQQVGATNGNGVCEGLSKSVTVKQFSAVSRMHALALEFGFTWVMMYFLNMWRWTLIGNHGIHYCFLKKVKRKYWLKKELMFLVRPTYYTEYVELTLCLMIMHLTLVMNLKNFMLWG